MNDYLYLYYSRDLLFFIFTSFFLESFYIMLTWSLLEYVYPFLILLHVSSIFLIDPKDSGFPNNLLAGRDNKLGLLNEKKNTWHCLLPKKKSNQNK